MRRYLVHAPDGRAFAVVTGNADEAVEMVRTQSGLPYRTMPIHKFTAISDPEILEAYETEFTAAEGIREPVYAPQADVRSTDELEAVEAEWKGLQFAEQTYRYRGTNITGHRGEWRAYAGGQDIVAPTVRDVQLQIDRLEWAGTPPPGR